MDLSKGITRVTITIDVDADAMKRNMLENDPELQDVTSDIIEDAMQDEILIVLDEVGSKIEAGNIQGNDRRSDGRSRYFFSINSAKPGLNSDQ